MPPMDTMTLEEKAGVAASHKKLSERRFKRFKSEKEKVKERRTSYDKADFRKIKALRKDTVKQLTDWRRSSYIWRVSTWAKEREGSSS